MLILLERFDLDALEIMQKFHNVSWDSFKREMIMNDLPVIDKELSNLSRLPSNFEGAANRKEVPGQEVWFKDVVFLRVSKSSRVKDL